MPSDPHPERNCLVWRERLPGPAQNNLWYEYNEADVVIVFVHGILSDSRSCWLRKGSQSQEDVFWPELIASDPRIGRVPIFLGGYYTSVDSGSYDIGDSAQELMSSLEREDLQRRPPPIAKQNMIFVCHSTGGIIVRYLLDHYYDRFRSKKVGLLLIASPSYGSILANKLGGLTRFYGQALGIQLEWANTNLQLLDERFKTMIDEKRIPNLVGAEAFENHFVVHRKWLPDNIKVVDELSAGRGYFGRPILLRNTDHFSCVKPGSVEHPTHELIVDFWAKHFATAFETLRQPGSGSPTEKNAPAEYLCYLSRDKIEQLTIDDRDLQPSASASCISELQTLRNSQLTYGRPDILQSEASVKREYVRKLRRVLDTHAAGILLFDGTNGTPGGLFWFRGELALESIDQEARIARLKGLCGPRSLILYCSLDNFSSSLGKAGFTISSTNYAFFKEQRSLTMESVFYLVALDEHEAYGSPLFLKLAILKGVVL